MPFECKKSQRSTAVYSVDLHQMQRQDLKIEFQPLQIVVRGNKPWISIDHIDSPPIIDAWEVTNFYRYILVEFCFL